MRLSLSISSCSAIAVKGSGLSAKQIGTMLSAGGSTSEIYAETIALVVMTKTTAEEAIRTWKEGQTSNTRRVVSQ
jgi:hypothetical protein